MFNLQLGEAARDEGLNLVSKSNRAWMDMAMEAIAAIPKGWIGIPEDYRFIFEDIIGPPSSPNAYGALTRLAIQQRIIAPTGVRIPMKYVQSHARMTDQYIKL